ncbi:hypothetical protein MWU75_07115 [Ornithinimicrobium sp. F0845]|nr:hypothetical protein [Ornithinimicrobium sp. F0845]MCK0111904.1 hypothetical protein [Ornithinimicrobium sp. F0845]
MTQNPDVGPLARAGADLREASEAAAKADRILEQVDRELEELDGGGPG